MSVRSFHAVIYDFRLYVAGGFTDNQGQNVSSNLWCLDLSAVRPKWTVLAPIPTPRAGCAYCCLRDNLILAGGMRSYLDTKLIDVVEAFSISQGSWHVLKSMNRGLAFRTAVSLSQHSMLVFGGFSHPAQYEASCEYFDDREGAWKEISPMKYKRAGACALLLPNSKVMLLGGHMSNLIISSSVELFDPERNEWEEGPAMPEGRSEFAAAIINNRL